MNNGAAGDLLSAGAVLKTAFCGPCFGAGDTPANQALSIRHSTRNFPNREGSKLQNGQIASVALMDARSIAATAAARGFLTGADELDVEYTGQTYHFDSTIYANRVFDSHGKADPETKLQFGPNIKDWPEMTPLTENLLLRVVSLIHDPVTTTDELIPSGETSSYRSNPEALSQFTLSRKDPAYVGRAREMREVERARRSDSEPTEVNEEIAKAFLAVWTKYPEVRPLETGIGTTIYAVKPGDGSAREQAASCQKVLGGRANIAGEYATKRYRSNLINWGMIPFLLPEEELPFENMDFLFIPGIRAAITEGAGEVSVYRIQGDEMIPFKLGIGEMTADERQIILDGCLINYYKGHHEASTVQTAQIE